MGEEVLISTNTTNQSPIKVNVSWLEKGMYFVQISTVSWGEKNDNINKTDVLETNANNNKNNSPFILLLFF